MRLPASEQGSRWLLKSPNGFAASLSRQIFKRFARSCVLPRASTEAEASPPNTRVLHTTQAGLR
eukprot:scaffold1567_cov228-Pinguiococcus_pyrenoidosus.AAC.1